jgi:guanosine-3',5'-bis(diphosphate) 3'-pyrophosphohydrolase
MVKRNIDISQIYDIIAFRIIVKTIPECYQVLGIIHSIWKPVPGRFKDFIAMPKNNMYQSLHTTVIGPFGDFIEIQIRTEEMHKIAEEGIAAHWLYKENKTKDDESFKVFNWLRKVMELKDDIKDANQFFHSIKNEVLSDSIYVFTPDGEIIELPTGSTPVDFAYAIHTAVGNSCIGAKVNGTIVPLNYKLQTGDRVEILTSKNAKPNKDWLKFVKTSKARSKIRYFIKQEAFETNVSIGKVLLEKTFVENKINLDYLKKEKELLEIAKMFNFIDVNTFLAAIGYGRISPKQVVNRLIPDEQKKKDIKKEKETDSKKLSSGIKIDGEANYLIHFAKCCNPLPGEEIIGFITRGKGITVHSANCKNVINLDPDRIVNVEWDYSKVEKRVIRIKLVAKDRRGLLLEISNVISNIGLNMTNVHIDTTSNGLAISYFNIEMRSSEEFDKLVAKLNKIPGVLSVEKVY